MQQRASKAFPHAERAIDDFQPTLNFARTYTPDIFNGFGKLGQITGYYDGNGHYARVQVALNLFKRNSSGELEPIAPSEQLQRLWQLRRRSPPLPGRRHPAGRGRLQPVHRAALRGLRCQPIRLQPGRRATRTMRKALIAAAVAAAIVVVVLLAGGNGNGNGGYVVRAIFDSGGFMVKGEEVRVAGATVGEIESVDVTMPGEVDSYENGKQQAVPGKAVIVMKIEDPGFQDFRSDASCLIRPQSLIGEKFIDCRPTLPRAPGSPPPPSLKEIPDDEPGAGQYLLPLENNSTSVDPDLINNIQQLPYAQRFRLIFNELGASLAGRGEDLEEVVKRANPVLRDTDRLFGILREQRDQLAQLAADSEADPRAAFARARQRRRLLHQRRRRRSGQLRKGRGAGSLAAKVPPLPA